MVLPPPTRSNSDPEQQTGTRRFQASVSPSSSHYTNSTIFEPFPFPVLAADNSGTVGSLAEQLDAHRKRQQAAAYPGLTLTGMYNVLEKLRSGDPLTAKERTIHEQGLVSVLRQLHDELDDAVLEAYGWSDLLPLLRVAHGNEAPADGQSIPEPSLPVPAPCDLLDANAAKE